MTQIPPSELITALIPVSPIKSHPSTHILDETLASIVHHLPDVKIIITLDGIRQEQTDRTNDYTEFIRRIDEKIGTGDYKDVQLLRFAEHSHQVKMARTALKIITTPLLLYCEMDTPLITDYPIDWAGIANLILTNQAKVVRLYHESVVPEAHQDMMYDNKPITIGGIPLIRTRQYSQRPSVASVEFYKYIIDACFSNDAVCFIEDVVHGVIRMNCDLYGLHGWESYKVVIYAPEGNYQRSYHTDGRAGEDKFESTQRF